jgi:hypothetical protein
MWRIRGLFGDGADAVDPSSSDPAARDDGLSAFPQFGAGAPAPSLSNDPPAEAGGAPGGGSGTQLSLSRVAAIADSDLSPTPPTGHVAYDPLGCDAGLGGAGAPAPSLSNDAPADAGGVLRGGSGPAPSISGIAPMADSDLLPNPPTLHVAHDPLAAFLDGLNGFPSFAGAGMSPFLPAGAGATQLLLSNGLNVAAGVAQLVSALASVPDGNSAFNATPFAPQTNPEPQTILAGVATHG